MTKQGHWQAVYEKKAPTEVSWYSERLSDSLRLIRDVAALDARIVDVGGGASTLVDDLLDAGYRKLTVLDLSATALQRARDRLGERADAVAWLVADVTSSNFGADAFDVWHDRAVFHFLTEQAERQAYVAQLRRSVATGGQVIMGTFSLKGPTRCSGLEVVRYDAETLAATLGDAFTLTQAFEAKHVTPAGGEQSFQFCSFVKR